MKKISLIVVMLLGGIAAHAQFFQGWGLMAGGTLGRQYWNEFGNVTKHKYLLRYNGEIFGEFGNHPTFRWVTELQYNVKGTKRVLPDSPAEKLTSDYAAWNNYLMIRREFFSFIPYIKIGPRAEYVFNSDMGFDKFHITGSAGAGVEFIAYGPVRFLTEFHWVPDLTESFNTEDFKIKQHAWELRVGLKFSLGGKESCPKVYR
jgi:hypothetical protein